MSKRRIRIELKPITSYFFGGEQTFKGTGDAANYFAKSELLPQQTTILGMLRYNILSTVKLLDNKNTAVSNTYIGSRSFAPGVSDFGILSDLTPVFLTKTRGSKYFKLPKESFMKNETHQYYQLTQVANTDNAFLLQDEDEEDFNAKYPFRQAWISDSADDIIDEDQIFIGDVRTGIRKARNGQTQDNAFYKQSFINLKEDFAFGVFMSVDTDLINNQKHKELIEAFFEEGTTHHVQLGAEKVVFEMKIVTAAADKLGLPTTYPMSPTYEKLILLSDAYIENLDSIYEHKDFVFAIASPKSFKNIMTDGATEDFVRLDRSEEGGNKQLRKSKMVYMLKRGSVFYCTDGESLASVFKSESFENIGYNQTTIIKKQVI